MNAVPSRLQVCVDMSKFNIVITGPHQIPQAACELSQGVLLYLPLPLFDCCLMEMRKG